jgi:NADH oxidase (H2O2-forming)
VHEKRRILVIGGGPAGITFSRKLRSLDPCADIVMLRPEEHSMVYCAIPYAIEGLFDPAKVYKSDQLVTEAGVRLLRRRAAVVDAIHQTVTDSEGETHPYDLLFFAAGAIPSRPPIQGADADNSFTVKTGEDMRGIIQRIDGGANRAVVIGAGAIGIEQAQAYRERGLETWLIDMAPHVLPSMIDEDMSPLLHEALREHGIQLRLGRCVETLETAGRAIERVVLSDHQAIELDPARDFVCFATGMRPDSRLLADAGVETSRDGIPVDSRMRTSIPTILAAGDCCAYTSGIDGRPVGGKLATNAVPMAKVAAFTAAGIDREYPGFFNGAATCVEDWRIGSTGFTATAARARGFEPATALGKTTTLFPMMPGADALIVKIVADKTDGRLLGGQILSKLPATDKTDILTLAIQQRMTAADLAELSYSAQPWQSFFPASNAIVEACEKIASNHS